MQLITGGLILLIYIAIAFGEIPKLRMNRATIALVGAGLLVLIGAINEEQAIHAIDLGTLFLLGAMMVLNVNLRLAGFFRFIGSRALRIANTPRVLLAMVIFPAGFLCYLSYVQKYLKVYSSVHKSVPASLRLASVDILLWSYRLSTGV